MKKEEWYLLKQNLEGQQTAVEVLVEKIESLNRSLAREYENIIKLRKELNSEMQSFATHSRKMREVINALKKLRVIEKQKIITCGDINPSEYEFYEVRIFSTKEDWEKREKEMREKNEQKDS